MKSKSQITIREQHLRCVALHEICHAFVELPRASAVLITLQVNRSFPSRPKSKAWDGRAEARVLDEDRFKDSVNGWAGVIGEANEEQRLGALEFALEKYRKGRESISETDLRLIEAVEEHLRPRSAQSAYDILIENWGAVTRLLERVLELIEGNKLEIFMFIWTRDKGWVLSDADKL